MKNFRYSILDIKNNKFNFIVFFIQLFISLFVMAIAINKIIDTNQTINNLNELRNKNNYILGDVSTNEHLDNIIENTEIDKIRNIIKMIQKIDGNYYSIERIDSENDESNYTDSHLLATYNFNKLFDIKLNKGRFFNKEDEKNNKIVPVIIGKNLESKYELNKVYKTRYYGSDKEIDIRVVGILENNDKIFDLRMLEYLMGLNDSMIFCINDYLINNYLDITSLHSIVFHAIISTNNTSYLDDIIKYSENNNLFSIEYISYNKYINAYVESIMPTFMMLIFVSIIIIIFSLFGIISHLVLTIKRQERDFVITLIYGAKKKIL